MSETKNLSEQQIAENDVARIERVTIERITLKNGQQMMQIVPFAKIEDKEFPMPIDVMTSIISMAQVQNAMGAMGMLKPHYSEPEAKIKDPEIIANPFVKA